MCGWMTPSQMSSEEELGMNRNAVSFFHIYMGAKGYRPGKGGNGFCRTG
jgi:hypothetical protein